MPYATTADLPANIKKLSAKQQRQWQQIWNSSYSRCIKGGKSKDTCEASAFKQANGVVLAKHAAFALDPSVTEIQAGGPLRPAVPYETWEKEAMLTKPKPAPAPPADREATHAGGMAVFDLGAPTPLYEADDEQIVYRPGLLFRAGDYPDKKFAMTPEEIVRAAAAFDEPVDIDLEHVDTPLSGQLGQVVSVYASDDGTEFHGIVAIPKWLDQILPHRRVSATWDRAKKTLAGLALVNHPRVSDAALMAAFAVEEGVRDEDFREKLLAQFAPKRHDTPQGQGLLQSIHDITARRGAICDQKNVPKKADMSSSHEQKAVQAIHDMTAEHGATCAANSGDYPYKESSGIRDSNAPYFSDPAASGTPTPPPQKEGTLMDRFAQFMAWLQGADPAEGSGAPQAPPAAPAAPAAPASGLPAPVAQPASAPAAGAPAPATATYGESDRTRQLEAELARLRAERIAEKAAAFADKLITDARAFPAERAQIILTYEQNARDDIVLGPAKFSVDGKEVDRTRVEQFEQTMLVRPAHLMTAESLGPSMLGMLRNQQETEGFKAPAAEKPLDDKELREAIALTPMGRNMLTEMEHRAARNGTGR